MNVVFLQGRLSSDPVLRELSSGSRLLSLEVTTTTDDGTANVPVAWFDPPTVPDWAAGVDIVVHGDRQAAVLPRSGRHAEPHRGRRDRDLRGQQAPPGAASARTRGRRARRVVAAARYDSIVASSTQAMPTRDGSYTTSRSCRGRLHPARRRRRDPAEAPVRAECRTSS